MVMLLRPNGTCSRNNAIHFVYQSKMKAEQKASIQKMRDLILVLKY